MRRRYPWRNVGTEELGKSMRTVQRYVDRIKTKLVPMFKQARLVDKAV